MTQIIDEKLKKCCDNCHSLLDKPCAWLSLGNEYCTEIMEVNEEIERLNNIINEKDKDFELLRKAQLKKCQEYENLEKLNNANYQSFIEVNNIINELEKWLKSESNFWKEQQEKAIKNGWLEFGGKYNTTIIYENAINKLQELKGEDKK